MKCLVLLVVFFSSFAQAQSSPSVFLNHFVHMLDADTATDVKNSPFFLSEFAGGYTNASPYSPKPADPGTVWIFFGETTYLELFDPKGDKGLPGTSKFGFGTDYVGDLKQVNSNLQKSFSTTEFKLFDHLLMSGGKPWFWLTEFFVPVAPNGFAIKTWIMEYHPDLVGSPDVTRMTYNSSGYKSDRLMKDIVAVEATVSSEQLKFFEKLLLAYNYSQTVSASETVFDGPKFQVRLKTGVNAKLDKIVFAINKAKAHPLTYRFGPSSTLEFRNDDMKAVWNF